MIVRLLQPSDDRSRFSCGDPDYDNFIRKYAGQNQFKHRVSSTVVAVEDERVIGYATFAIGEISVDALPAKLARTLPRYPCPVLRMGRLAVDARFHNAGIGSYLVAELLDIALRLRDELGCVAVVVDALAQRESFYSQLGFVRLGVSRGRSGVKGTVPLALSLTEVEEARRCAP